MEKRIRRGGVRTQQGFMFELSGGDVSLDLVNTLDNRPTEHPRELIPVASDLFSWARQAGLLSRKEENELRRKAARKPGEAEKVRRGAVHLRECLFKLFSSIADGKATPDDVLAQWNAFVQDAMDHYETVRSPDGLKWKLRSDPRSFDRVLWPIVHSAVQLLTGPQSLRVRRCSGADCDWLFLDTSKRGNRRWCDMTVCGNRAKARRFYHRKKSAQ